MTSLCLSLVLAAGSDFALVEEIDGVRIEARAVSGSSFVELRYLASSPADVETLCRAAYGDGTLAKDEQTVRERRVISEGDDTRVTYDWVTTPIVSDRDYTLRWTRLRSERACIVRFGVVDAGVPEVKGRVRLSRVSGEWRFTPKGTGTEIVYVSHAEPGGGLPPFIVEGPRRKAELDVVRRVIARAKPR